MSTDAYDEGYEYGLGLAERAADPDVLASFSRKYSERAQHAREQADFHDGAVAALREWAGPLRE